MSCGTTGHLPKACRVPPLSAWEREQLRAIVFPEGLYQNSRSARLFRAGLEISEKESQEEDARLYTQLGYLSSQGGVQDAEESVGSRLSKLELEERQEAEGRGESAVVEEHLLASRATGQDSTKEAITKGPYRTVSIDDLLQQNESVMAGKKRPSGSGSSGLDRPVPKREKKIEAIPLQHHSRDIRPLPERRKEPGAAKKARKSRKRIADMTEGEKVEREARKGQRRQLKMIKGMAGEKRFDVAKALANTQCPISWLQYFQDSPVARMEMSRITSLTSDLIAAMFGDAVPNVRTSAMAGIDELGETLPIDRPRLGTNGAFMVTATISSGKKDGPTFTTDKVCVDAGSECDLATPAMIRKAEGEVIPISETPWPTLSIRTSSGAFARLLGIARIRVDVHGISRIVYACVIPPNFATTSGYDLLLGVPWLFEVNGRINVGDGTVSVFNDVTRKDVIIDTGRFTPPNFKVMFDQSDENRSAAEESGEDESEESSSEGGSDSGEESVKSSDARPTLREYSYPEIMSKYSKDRFVSSRSATLVVEEEEVSPEALGSRREVARIRYVTAEDYLRLYGTDGPYSHLARAVMELAGDDEEDAMLIIDSENRQGMEECEGRGWDFPTGVILGN